MKCWPRTGPSGGIRIYGTFRFLSDEQKSVKSKLTKYACSDMESLSLISTGICRNG